jgi:hypothetical protein
MNVGGRPVGWRPGLLVAVVAALISVAGGAAAQPCSITELRVGGEQGDNYIGPVCNTDGTYRTTFYIKGSGLS